MGDPARLPHICCQRGVAGQAGATACYVGLLLELDPERHLSNLADVLGPYRRLEDIVRY